jgi:hypothetical protein
MWPTLETLVWISIMGGIACGFLTIGVTVEFLGKSGVRCIDGFAEGYNA